MSKRVAGLVLSCASPPYPRMLETIRRTWGRHRTPGIDIYYLYGNPEDGEPRAMLSRHIQGESPTVEPGGMTQLGEVLVAGCADSIDQQEDCLLRKRLIAFDFLTGIGDYDLIYTVCASSYVDTEQLARHVDSLPSRPAIWGAVGVDEAGTSPYVSGASMLLTADVARELADHREAIIEENRFGFRDDVALTHWIATRMTSFPLASVIDDIHEGRPLSQRQLIANASETTVDYVTRPPSEHRPVAGAYHYHFHSDRPYDMARFHQHHFARRNTDAT